jgi:hypothetical protein
VHYRPIQTAGKDRWTGYDETKGKSITFNKHARRSDKEKRLLMAATKQLDKMLRVGRPSKYNGSVTNHGNWEDILAKFMSGELVIPNAGGNAATAAATNQGFTIKKMNSKTCSQ